MELIIRIKNNIEKNIDTLVSYLNMCNNLNTDDMDIIVNNNELSHLLFSYINKSKIHEVNNSLKKYNTLLNKINRLLYKYCIHNKVYDSIDIDPDNSKTIVYCDKCLLTLD
jgi:hypothetical protein